MIRKILYLFILGFVLSWSSAMAQDKIITNDGRTILAIIQEITPTEIIFQDYNEAIETSYRINKSSVQKIVFESGIEETFHDNKSNTEIIRNTNTPNQPPAARHDKIYTMDGRILYVRIVEKKKFGFSFVYVNESSGYEDYLSNSKINRIEYADGTIEYVSGVPEKNKNSKKSPKDFNYLTPHYVSIGIGAGIPFGNFGATASGGGGYAKVGLNATLDASYYFLRGAGLGVLLGYSYNPFNGKDLRNAMLQQEIPEFATDKKVETGNWNVGYALAGIGYYNDLGRVFIDYKVMIGATFSQYPSAYASYNDTLGFSEVVYKSNTGIGFAFGAYTGVRYFLTRKWAVKGSISMIYSNVRYDNYTRTKYVNGEVAEPIGFAAPAQMISLFNIGAGITYTLGR